MKKKKFWKPYLKFLLFLAITIVIVLPYLSLLSTIFHEQAHIKAAAKHNIQMNYEPDILLRIPHFFQSLGPAASGKSSFATESDKAKYLSLSVAEKREITMAGIGSDIFFMIMINLILFTLGGIPYFFKDRKLVSNVSLLSMILIIWLIHLIWSNLVNLTYAQGDLTFLIKSILVQ